MNPTQSKSSPNDGPTSNDTATSELSGDRTSSPSTSFAEDSPVKTSAKPANEPELRDLARVFGLTMPVSLGSFDPGTCSLRTFQGSLFTEQCDELSESFPDSGMWDAGEVYELVSSEPVTSESASLLWPTPTKHDQAGTRGKNSTFSDSHYFPYETTTAAETWTTPRSTHGGANSNREERERAGGPDLKEQSETWLTPHGMSNKDFRGKTGGCGGGEFALQANRWSASENIRVDQQARMFPTPASRDCRTPNKKSFRERGGKGKGEQLQNFVAHTWPTPTESTATMEDMEQARYSGDGGKRPEYSECRSLPDLQTPDGLISSETSPTSRRRLNPRFVEWLMGFPIGWTELCKTAPKDSEGSETL